MAKRLLWLLMKTKLRKCFVKYYIILKIRGTHKRPSSLHYKVSRDVYGIVINKNFCIVLFGCIRYFMVNIN